jgi:hypothetical protein
MKEMGVGETGAVKGDKPQVHTDKSPSAGSVKKFNEALGQSAGSASSTQAAAGAAARAPGGKPAIVRIDANYRSKSATATLSDGSKVPLALTKNQLAPGDTLHNLEYGSESGPEDSPVVELSCASGASCSILWTQPSDYALSPKVIVSIKQDPEEGARRRIERLPPFIQDHLKQIGGGEKLESLAKMGEDLVKVGAKKEDFAPIEIQAKAPADPDFHFVEAARKGMYSKFSSFDEFKKDLTRQVEFAKNEARAKGLNPPDPFEGAEWKDDPAAAKEKWDKYVFAQYDKALKNEAAGLRHVGEVASMAQNAIFEALGLSAALGTGGALLAAGGEALALPTLLEGSTGVSTSTWLGQFAKFGLGTSFGMNLINRGKEGIDAGSNPVSVVSAALTDTIGGRGFEKITNKSNLTGRDLNLSTGERVAGGIFDLFEGGMNILGVREFVKAPGVAEPPVPGRTPAEPTVNDPTPPKPNLGVPTYSNLSGRVPAGGQRIQIVEQGGKYFERNYETGALAQASGEYAFARMPDGSLWASRYGHAEASMGGPVAYAGQLKFENGALKEWSGASGTYRPAGGDLAKQAGFNIEPETIAAHPGKKVQLPVFRDPPGSVTTAGNGGKGTVKAPSGGEAADTIRMQKAGSGEGSSPSGATSVSGSKTGEITRDIPDGGDTVKMRKAGGADAPKAESSASSASGSAAGAKAVAGTAVPTKSVDQIVDAYTQGRSPGEIRNSVTKGDMARLKEEFKKELRNNQHDPAIADQISEDQYRRMAMADDVYRHYNQPTAGKPQPKISQAQLTDRLKGYDGPTLSSDGWHVRMNKSPAGTTADHSWVNADRAHPVDRFYVNVKADHAPEFADYVSGELNKKGIKFQLKVPSEVDGYARADSGLVYTQGKDFEAVRDVISKYRDLHPEAIAEGSPAFTKPMGKGISVAEEPLQEGLPVVYHGGHSFGTARANLIAEAINQAPANASAEQVKVFVRAKLQTAGFDPDRPWLAQGSKIDRLNVGDANVVRNSARNGGVAFDDTLAQPAVGAAPQASPSGQGGPGRNNGASGGAGGGGSNGSGGTGASSADIADQAAAKQHAEQVRNYKGPNFRADPSQGGSVAIDSLLVDMQKGNLKVVDNAFNSKFHDQVWQDLTGKQGQAPAAYTIGDSARVDLNRLTPEQLQRYRTYVQKQDAAKGPH